MAQIEQTIRLGAVQAEPIWLDLQGTVEKTMTIIQDAGKKSINVLGFPEVYIPDYPWQVPLKVHSYSLSPKQLTNLWKLSAEAGNFVVLGYSERSGKSLNMEQSSISPDGVISMHRRKMKPTHIERTIWGERQTSSLKSVADFPFKKIATASILSVCSKEGEQIHVAAGPAFFEVFKDSAWAFQGSPIASNLARQFTGIGNGSFVLVSTQVVKEDNLDSMHLIELGVTDKAAEGFAMIYGPDRRQLVEALAPDEGGILAADVPLSDIDDSKTL